MGRILSRCTVTQIGPDRWISTLYQDTYFIWVKELWWGAQRSNISIIIITLSSTEAEYIAQTHTAKEALWIRMFIGKFHKGFGSLPILINCNNHSAITLVKDNKFHPQTKHIDLWYYFIHEAVEDAKINLNYIPTNNNVADIFTKALAKGKFHLFTGLLGLCEAWGGVLKYIQSMLCSNWDIRLSTGSSGFRSLCFLFEFIDVSHFHAEAVTWVIILHYIHFLD